MVLHPNLVPSVLRSTCVGCFHVDRLSTRRHCNSVDEYTWYSEEFEFLALRGRSYKHSYLHNSMICTYRNNVYSYTEYSTSQQYQAPTGSRNLDAFDFGRAAETKTHGMLLYSSIRYHTWYISKYPTQFAQDEFRRNPRFHSWRFYLISYLVPGTLVRSNIILPC